MFARRGVRIRVGCAAALVPLAFAVLASSAAADPVWQKIGPFVQGGVDAVAVDPRTPQIVYVGSDSGLFKSTNSGITWNFSGVGITADAVTAIAIDPKRTTTLFAGTPSGIFRSKDSGATWQLVYTTGLAEDIRTIAVHPSQPLVFAASRYAGPAPGGAPPVGRLVESVDGGSSWRQTPVAPGVAAPTLVWLDPFNSSRLFVATEDGLYRSDDLTAHWALKLAEVVTALSFDPAAAGVVYVGAATGADSALRSANSGDSWAPFGSGLPAVVRAIAQVPGPPATLYAASDTGLFKTTTGNGGWGPAATGLQGTFGVLVPFGAPENSVYAGSTAGLFKLQTTAAAALRLDSPFASLPPTSFAYIPGRGGALYAGVTDVPGAGVYRSSGGSGWTLVNGNLPDTDVVSLAMSPQVPAGCAAPCDQEPPLYAATGVGIYKTSDKGVHWASVNKGLPSRSVFRLVADPLQPATLYALVVNQGIAKTDTAGSNWTTVNEGLNSGAVTALAIDPTSSATLYCSAGGDIYKSTDGAAHWTALHAGIDAQSLAVAPTSPSTVYASLNGTIYRSPDGGTTWHALPVEGAGNLISVAVDPHSAGNVFAGDFSAGAFESTSAGADWSTLNAGLPVDLFDGTYPPVFGLGWDLASGRTLTAATRSGLFSIEPGPHAAVCTPAGDTLCLSNGRFQVRVAWSANNLGTSGTGQAMPLTSDTGYFWFFQPTNVELMIKVLDGRSLNGHFWVFYGALSDVQYAITVTDTVTGEERVFENPQGTLASVANTAAFPLGAFVTAGSAGLEEALARETASFEALAGMFAADAPQPSSAAAPCATTPTALCLAANRFHVEVEWHARHLGTSGVGQAVPLTADTGYFWFFQSTNVELVIKVLDARAFSGYFWVFYGALSDVEYTIRVTDTATGRVKTYFNPQDRLASVADTAAFQ